jgi:hypothetical protein
MLFGHEWYAAIGFDCGCGAVTGELRKIHFHKQKSP